MCQHAARERQAGVAWRQSQTQAIGSDERERCAHEGLGRVHAHGLHQPQRFGVRTDQDVLAVVELEAVDIDPAGAATELRCHLEQRDAVAASGRFDGSGQACPAAAHHSHRLCLSRHCPRQLVRMAIHSLRSGVSEVRWCSTWNPSASISRSSVR